MIQISAAVTGLVPALIDCSGKSCYPNWFLVVPIPLRACLGLIGYHFQPVDAELERDQGRTISINGMVYNGEITFKIEEVTVGSPGACAFPPCDVPHPGKNTGAEPAACCSSTPRRVFRGTVGPAGSDHGADAREVRRHRGWEIVGLPSCTSMLRWYKPSQIQIKIPVTFFLIFPNF
jgi:hypothetical protein